MVPTCHTAPELERSFHEALSEATAFAALSPSSHNCQPWGLARPTTGKAREAAAAILSGSDGAEDEYVALALDRRHELVALPAHAVEMRVSCGAYWRMLLRALAAQGWTPARVHVLGDGGRLPFGRGWPPDWSLLCVASMRHGEGSGERLADLYAAARDRRTNRGAYREERLDVGLLDTLARPVTAGGRGSEAPLITVQHLTGRQEREDFASFLAENAGRDFSHPEAWRETHSYLRWSPADAHACGDGFTLTQLFGTLSPPRHLAKRVTLAPGVMRLLCRLGYDRHLAEGLAAAVRADTPALVAMGFSDDEPGPAELLSGGARLADYWLEAARSGLALHPVSVVVQHADLRRSLQALLGLKGRTFFVSRLGRPATGIPPAPRRASAAGHKTL
jgi:nitroreductase